MTKSVKEHFDNCKQVSDIVDDANALLTKVQRELSVAREVLESLIEYQHQKLQMSVPYNIRKTNEEKVVTPAALIRLEITRINKILGDRA